MLNRPLTDLQNFARMGASMHVDGSRHNPDDVMRLALMMTEGTTLMVLNTDAWSVNQLQNLVRAGAGRVMLA